MPRDDHRSSAPKPSGTPRPPTASDTRELGEPAAEPSESLVSLEAGSGARATLTEMPSTWLDRLLAVSSELPLDEGIDEVARAIVVVVLSILPANHRVGFRLPRSGSSERGGPVTVVRSEPPKSAEQERGQRKTEARLFPDARRERHYPLRGDASGGFLHVAADEAPPEDDSSPVGQFLQRVVLVASDRIGRTLVFERAAAAEKELAALKSHLVQAEKLASLGQIAAGMVHELNNPLTSIVAYTDYLLRRSERAAQGHQVTGDAEDVERLRRIAESANRMLRFTRDLVSYARPSSEVPVPVPLHAVINRALAFCEHEIAAVGATVARDFDGGVGTVRGMPEQLAQVFVNLVTNACHAMPVLPSAPAGDGAAGRPECRLTISTSLVDGDRRVQIIVADTGHGIAASHVPLVFAPFFTTKGSGRGTGLGLSIVKNIIDSHRGEIHVESEPPNGTRFLILLPLDGRD